MDKKMPLLGKKILVTREKEQAKPFVKKIEKLGGTPIVVPLLSFKVPDDQKTIKETLQQLHTFDWLIFTSMNGIRFFFQQLNNEQKQIVENIKIAVVGTKTEKELEKHGFSAHLVPKEFVAESFACELIEQIGPKEKVLFPKGNLARDVISNELRKKGIHVCDLTIYETADVPESKEQILALLKEKKIDYITFTSSSTVDHFAAVIGENRDLLKNHVKLAGIGPITAQTAQKHQLELDFVAKVYTTDGLLEAIIESIEE